MCISVMSANLAFAGVKDPVISLNSFVFYNYLKIFRGIGLCSLWISWQAQPMNIPTSFKQRAMLIDEIWHASGDQSTDIDWYVKRTVLGGIYSTSEVYMVTDHSPGLFFSPAILLYFCNL